MRPISDHWPKPVLPIDGEPVVVTLLAELAAAGIERYVVVTGHLAGQVEALLRPLPYRLRFVRQPRPDGSLDAVRRAEPEPPFLAVAADTRFSPGDPARFLAAAAGGAGAIAVRRQPDRPEVTRVRVEAGLVTRVVAPEDEGGLTVAPLWYLGAPVAAYLAGDVPGPPFELARAFQDAIDAGLPVSAIQIGRTRDLTTPVDLVRENFPYLS